MLAGNYQLLQQLPATAGRPEQLVARRDLPAAPLKRLTEGLASHRPASSSTTAPTQLQASMALARK